MTRPVLIVPGLNGSGDGHWQAFWQRDHDDARLVEQDDWTNPDADCWMARLQTAVLANPGAVIVAHSLGAVLTARLATSPVAGLVAGALLVAPADIERTGTLHGRSYEFGAMPRQFLPFPSLVVASRNDPYMPHEKVLALATVWGSGVHDLGHAGHINVASGFGRWIKGYQLAEAATKISHEKPVFGHVGRGR